MHFSSNLTTILTTLILLRLSHIFATAASLPRQGSTANSSLFELSTSNVSKITPAVAAVSVPFPYRDITFYFTYYGNQIPRKELEQLFVSAGQAISDVVDEHPSDPIANNRFEYRVPGGNVFILVQVYSGKAISWAQIFRLLQGLYNYMLGSSRQQQRSQSLEFQVAIAGQQHVGLGLVSTFLPLLADVQKRARYPLSPPASSTEMLQLSNASNSCPRFSTDQDPIIWPTPQTTLTLNIYFRGMPIPSQKLTDTIQGAIAYVKRYLNTPYEDDGIDNDVFHWALPPNGDGTTTAFTVFSYISHDVTWRQVNDILVGLYNFTTGVGTDMDPHLQILGFRIQNLHEGTIGVGSLSYYPRRAGSIQKRTESVNCSLSQPSDSATSIPSVAAQGDIRWPVRDSAIVLLIEYQGRQIPKDQIMMTLGAALIKVTENVQKHAYSPIQSLHYQLENGDAVINILPYIGKSITWLQLSQILSGMIEFCDDGHNRVLVLDISSGEDRIGFGTLLLDSNQSTLDSVEKRSLNTTLTLPNFVDSIHYPIPGTGDSLTFTSLGQAIDPSRTDDAIRYVLEEIRPYVRTLPNARVPKNQYKYENVYGISINITASTVMTLTWLQLNRVLTGLACFMTGISPACQRTMQTHYQALQFSIYVQGEGYLGNGAVGYQHPSETLKQRRATSANDAIIQSPIINKTVAQPPIPFPIVNTPMTITFTEVGDIGIPISTVEEFFVAVFGDIGPFVQSSPNRPITPHMWFFKLTNPRGGATMSISIYTRTTQTISWLQLQKLLKGLEVFMAAQRFNLVFEIALDNNGPVAEGLVWYSPPRPPNQSRIMKRTAVTELPSGLQSPDGTQHSNSSVLSMPNYLPDSTQSPNASSTSLTARTSYPVPSTPVTLRINLSRDPIPFLYTTACLTTALRHIVAKVIELPEEHIPQNVFTYHNCPADVGLTYIGYSNDFWLSWRQLNWVLQGVLSFVNEDPRRSRNLAAEVDIDCGRAGRSQRFGSFLLWYRGDEPGSVV